MLRLGMESPTFTKAGLVEWNQARWLLARGRAEARRRVMNMMRWVRADEKGNEYKTEIRRRGLEVNQTVMMEETQIMI